MSKRTLYIELFVVLGVLIGFMVHAVIEMAIIEALVENIELYGLGLSWDTWFLIHSIGTILTLVLGASLGYWQGTYWWRIVYAERRRRGGK